MARDGYRIFDSDTHVGPDARILAGYLSEAEQDRLRGWEAYKSQDRSGHQTYTKGQRSYRRRLGTAKPDDAPSGYMVGFTGVKRTREPSPLVDADPGERIKDMDHEGVDVNLTLPSGWFGTWTAGDDVTLEMAMYRAYHRWMADYCGSYPTCRSSRPHCQGDALGPHSLRAKDIKIGGRLRGWISPAPPIPTFRWRLVDLQGRKRRANRPGSELVENSSEVFKNLPPGLRTEDNEIRRRLSPRAAGPPLHSVLATMKSDPGPPITLGNAAKAELPLIVR
jgi:hypothetical protein